MCYRTSSWLLCLVLAITASATALSGCGHRGPLYLPEDTEQDTGR